jgi:hypothetical protein
LQDVIKKTRILLQDSREPLRYSDEDLLGFSNDVLKRMALVRPDLFVTRVDFPCVAGQVVQDLPTDCIRLVNVIRIKGGTAVSEANYTQLVSTTPTWTTNPSGPAKNFLRNFRNPRSFYIYPQAPEDQVLIIEYSQSPRAYTESEEVGLLNDVYEATVVDGVVFLAESIDDENVRNGRAQMFKDNFTRALIESSETRPLTDTQTSGLNPKAVL